MTSYTYQMNNSRILGSVKWIILSYCIGSTVFLLLGSISSSTYAWQQLHILSLTILFSYYRKMNIGQLVLSIVLLQLVLSFLLRSLFISEYGDPFGPNAVDSLLYSKIATQIQHLDFTDTLRILHSHFKSDLSDYGFPLFLKGIYWIAGDEYSANTLLLITNCLLSGATTLLLYKNTNKIIQIKDISLLVSLLWGMNSGGTYLNVSGLKEPLFVFLCTLAMYLIYKIKSNRYWSNHLLFFITIGLIWLFRSYVTLFYLIIYLSYIYTPNMLKRYFAILCISSIIVCLVFTSFLIQYFPEIYYAMLHTNKFYGERSMAYRLISYILPFMAPIPRLVGDKYSQDLYIHSLSLIKFFLSIFGIWGSIYFIRKKITTFYPLITISLFTGLLLIVSGHMIEYRYSYVTMPSFYILMVCGAQYTSRTISNTYWLIACLILLLFNIGSY